MITPTIAIACLAAPPVFSDQTANADINAVHQPAHSHSFFAGGTVGDFNGDGWQDIYVPTGGMGPDHLYINDGDGTFTEQAFAWNIVGNHRGTGAVAADFNGDGHLDLYVTSLGAQGTEAPGRHKLYRNNGNSTFTDVAFTAGVNQSSSTVADGIGAAAGDYDLDGDLDLAVAGWLSNDGNRLFRNDGDGLFADVTATSGLTGINSIVGFAPRFADMNGDRYPELIWIGDFGSSRYYANDGDGTFTDLTASSGTSLDGTEMGFDVADVDEDGDFDFYVSTIATNNLYINGGSHSYVNMAPAADCDQAQWGWAVVAMDMNHDTLVDLIQTEQGGRQYAFLRTPGLLSYDEVGLTAGLTTDVSGRGLSAMDYDNDGDLDLVFFPWNDPVRLYRNDIGGADTHSIRIFLDAGTVADIPPGGIGSVVRVSFAGRTLTGRIDGGSNYLSQSEMSAHFGLGTTTMLDEVRVEWTNGDVTTLADVPADQTLTITAGDPCPADLDGDLAVGVTDFLELLSLWGPCVACPADLDGDGVVGVLDFLDLLSQWGPCP